MHGIGEVDHIGLTRQRDQLALRGEAEHLVVEQLELGVLQKLFRIGAFGQDADGVAQPGKGVGFVLEPLGRRAHAFLVERVRGDAEFGDLVHFLGADLQFDALVAGADHGGVDRTVVVLLRRRDVVLETAGHHRPGGVHDAERAVAGLDVRHHDAEAEDVGQAARSRPTCAPSWSRSKTAACGGHRRARRCRSSAGSWRAGFRSRRSDCGCARPAHPAAASPPHRLPDRAYGTRDPRAPRASPACPCGRRAAHRCPASPRRCGGARPAARIPACACCAGGRRA